MKIASQGWTAVATAWTRATPAPVPLQLQREDQQASQLEKMQEGLAKLKAMPRKMAQEKAAYLQRRLMELKQMLMHASPQQAKALMKELKSIASELGAVAKSAAGMGGEAPAAGAGAAQAPAATASEDQAPAADVAAVDASAPSTGAPAQGDAAAEAGAGQPQPAQAAGAGEGGDAASLKQVLTEARRLLKETLEMIKAKLGHGQKEALADLREAEKKLGEIDEALSNMDSGSLYTSLGDVGALSAPDSIPSINISV